MTYTLKVHNYYILRDAPVDPQHLPEPEPVDIEQLAVLATSAFPDIPSIADRIRQYGPQAVKMINTPSSAQDFFEVDQPTAYRITSVLELAKRIYAPSLGTLPLIRTAEDVYRQSAQLILQAKEELHVLLINNRYQLVHQELIAMGDRLGLGTIKSVDIFQPAIERRVNGIVLVHNHPSGDPTPSQEDIAFTQEVAKAAELMRIDLMDHVIVATGGYASALHPNQIQKI